MLPRILIVYTGGTFGMVATQHAKKGAEFMSVPNLSPQKLKKKFLLQVPEIQNIAHCDVEILMNRDSAHIGHSEWLLIAATIRKKWGRYDGIVLLHGTDTLAYTASVLSFLLSPCLKPIVITGAQRPLSALRSDARMNLISAIDIAARGPRPLVNQVSVLFGDKLFQGNRVRKKSASDFDAFESPHCAILAVVGSTIRYQDSVSVFETPSHSRQIELKPKLNKNVAVLHVTPGFPSQLFEKDLLTHLDGLVLVVFSSGTAPTHKSSFLQLLKTARKRDIPVVICTESSSQPPTSNSLPPSYAAAIQLNKGGCFWAGPMTPECAYVKTTLLLGQAQGIKNFASLWNQDLANEGTPEFG